jgi:hypothetical protein
MHQGAPRNIRDIAHLYISRPRKDAGRVAVVAVDRECFPGLHVANLALALAQDGHRLRVVEASGLVMNAACFLSLPPEVYAAPASRRPGGVVRAALGVEVRFSDEPALLETSGVLELVHAPPLDRDAGIDVFLSTCAAADVVVIARDPVALAGDAGGGRRVWLLEVGPTGPIGAGGALLAAGRIDRWERSLADVVPAVLRDPESTLSRQYREASRRIISQHPDGRNHADTDGTAARRRRVRAAPSDL